MVSGVCGDPADGCRHSGPRAGIYLYRFRGKHGMTKTAASFSSDGDPYSGLLRGETIRHRGRERPGLQGQALQAVLYRFPLFHQRAGRQVRDDKYWIATSEYLLAMTEGARLVFYFSFIIIKADHLFCGYRVKFGRW